jgi:hypothetical protein
MRAIMERRGLTRRELADGLNTSPHTLRGWLDRGYTPPAVLASALDVIESSSQARSRLGLSYGSKLPRGRAFARGNPWRLNDPRREAALAESRQRKLERNKHDET